LVNRISLIIIGIIIIIFVAGMVLGYLIFGQISIEPYSEIREMQIKALLQNEEFREEFISKIMNHDEIRNQIMQEINQSEEFLKEFSSKMNLSDNNNLNLGDK